MTLFFFYTVFIPEEMCGIQKTVELLLSEKLTLFHEIVLKTLVPTQEYVWPYSESETCHKFSSDTNLNTYFLGYIFHYVVLRLSLIYVIEMPSLIFLWPERKSKLKSVNGNQKYMCLPCLKLYVFIQPFRNSENSQASWSSRNPLHQLLWGVIFLSQTVCSSRLHWQHFWLLI